MPVSTTRRHVIELKLSAIRSAHNRKPASAKLIDAEDVSGAGYGDRTRLTGLGSQDITTMLSPRCRYFTSAFALSAEPHPSDPKGGRVREPDGGCRARGAGRLGWKSALLGLT